MQSSDVEAQVHDLPGSWQRFAQATAQGAMIRFHSRRSALSLAVFLLLSTSIAMPRAVAADDSGILRLHDRQHATGQMVPTEVPGMLAWQHPGFVDAFHFPLASVVSVSFPATPGTPAAKGQFGFALAGGGLFYGNLLAADEQTIRVATETLGELELRRDRIQRMFRWRNGEDRLYVGPGKIQAWQSTSDKAWSDAGGSLATDQPESMIAGDVGLPSQAAIDFKIAWDEMPNFRLFFGVDAETKLETSRFSGFRIEVWEDELVLLSENEQTADIALIGPIGSVPGHIRLSVLLDQAQQRVMVLGPDGQVAAEMQFEAEASEEAPKPFSGIGFENIRGSVRLESVVVSAGSDEMFAVAKPSGEAAWLDGNEKLTGRLMAVEDDGETLIFEDDQQATQRVAAERLMRLTLQPLPVEGDQPEDREADAVADPQDDPSPKEGTGELTVILRSGMRLVGKLQRITEEGMSLEMSALPAPIVIPLTDVRDLVVFAKEAPKPRKMEQRVGLLNAADTSLRGAFQEGVSEDDASCFVFAPLWADNSRPLRRDAAAEMIYGDQPNKAKPSINTIANQNVRNGVAVRQVLIQNAAVPVEVANQPQAQAVPVKKRTLHLRAGDTVECEVLSIDEEGVAVRCAGDVDAMVPHAQIRAMEFSVPAETLSDGEKKVRLLTVPRMRRDNPPTHLLVSVDGDYLRGRLISMNGKTLVIETRLDQQTVDRNLISQIIWLHTDEILGPDGQPLPPKKNADGEVKDVVAEQSLSSSDFAGLVQVVRADGTRLSFVAEAVRDGVITGTNQFLGPCSQSLATIDRLLFSSRIQTESHELPFSEWRLTHAPDPMVFREGGEEMPGGGSDGKASSLVGQPAPEFELALLGGEKYRLSDHRGSVIVLDFWASWCGPCMQAMPNVDKMIREFDGQDIQLIAVNLQESEKRIEQALERLELETTVAMDVTGEIAERYQATAIPQTVVVDRQGNVSHLFVGGGTRTLQQLRDAVTTALEAK